VVVANTTEYSMQHEATDGTIYVASSLSGAFAGQASSKYSMQKKVTLPPIQSPNCEVRYA